MRLSELVQRAVFITVLGLIALCLVSLFMVCFLPAANAQEPLTARQVAETLGNTAVAVTYQGSTICTAARIGPSQFLTAKHCLVDGQAIELPNGRRLKVKSALVAQEIKDSVAGRAGRDEDWAIINTVEDEPTVQILVLACGEEPYLGQEVAYAGFPHPTQYALGLGRVTSIKPVLERANNLDYVMDVAAAPGASGSPVISLDTGAVIGILTEGVFSRFGPFMVGFESIQNLDACEGFTPADTPSGLPSADAMEK